MRVLLAIAVLVHAFLGLAILTPMVHASSAAEVREMGVMIMTPVVPMSPLHCRGCIIEHVDAVAADAGVPCDQGPCLRPIAPLAAVFCAGCASQAAAPLFLAWQDAGGPLDPAYSLTDDRPPSALRMLSTVILRE